MAGLILLTILAVTWSSRASEPPSPTELLLGFEATPDTSLPSFQPLLFDPSGNFSLGFLRVDPNRLALSVLHVPSSVQLWSANPTRLATWGAPTKLLFNGSLVLSDARAGVFWSTHTDGARVRLSDASNLAIQSLGAEDLWRSFDFPSDTLVETQNFTSAMALSSSNGLYSMRLGPNFMGLYARFGNSDPGQIYLRHGALEVKAEIIEGLPIRLVLEPDGYLGMYQNGSLPVDVLPFNTFQRNAPGILRVTLEPDGNLKGYYWTGSGWMLDYRAITEACEMPSACGAYGLCRPGKGCSCLENRTVRGSGGCENRISGELDFCGPGGGRFTVLRRTGVDLPFKELMGYERMSSLEMCEGACEAKCTCWGVAYSNSSGFCYTLDYPIQTLAAIGDETKVGYFKVREGAGKVHADSPLGLGLVLGAALVFAGVLGLCRDKLKSRGKRHVKQQDSVVGIGQYKYLGTADVRAIELCER